MPFDGLICVQSSTKDPGFIGNIKVPALPFNSLSTPLSSPLCYRSTEFIQTNQHNLKYQRAILINLINCTIQLFWSIYVCTSFLFPSHSHSNIQTMKNIVLHAALLPRRADGALPVLAERAPHGNSRVCVCFTFIPDALCVLFPSQGSPLLLLQTAWLSDRAP